MLKWLLSKLRKIKSKPGQNKKITNLVPDPTDVRDYKAKTNMPIGLGDLFELPLEDIRLLQYAPEVKIQGILGSCASMTICNMYELMMRKNQNRLVPLSELFHYYSVRDVDPATDKDTAIDAGQYPREGLKVAQKTGISPEAIWPYITKNYNTKPGTLCYVFARLFRIKAYYRVYSLDEMKRAITKGYPVFLAMQVYSSFLTHKGDYYKDKIKGDKLAGGHAMTCLAYSDEKEAFLLLNSWGNSWGNKGYSWISYDYIRNYVYDMWIFDI